MQSTRATMLLATTIATALTLGACSGGATEQSDADGGPITLSVATFNEFGYEDLFSEYEQLNPNITIEHVKADTADNARAALRNSLGADSGAADIEAIEVDWVAELRQYPDKFVSATDIAWYDSAGALWQGMINQVEFAYETPQGDVIALDNPQVRQIYDQVLTASVHDELSAGLGQWSNDWASAFQGDEFATMLCPAWMLGVIEGNAEGTEGWDVAPVFPGGAGNWGGSYLTVPAQGEHPEEAKRLAEWLTAPEQQLKAFESKGTFPSQVEALDSPALADSDNSFFNDAPTGQIFTDRAEAVTMIPYKGPKYFEINTAMADAITRVDVDRTDDPVSSWDKFAAAVGDLR